MRQVKEQFNTAAILISHDLGVAAELCDSVAIILKRGFWLILRLYTPDADMHERVARYLEGRLKKM